MNQSGFDVPLGDAVKLNNCLQKSPFVILITDEIGIIQFTTDAISDMTGYSAEEIVGNSILKYSLRKDWATIVDLLPILDGVEVARKINFIKKNTI